MHSKLHIHIKNGTRKQPNFRILFSEALFFVYRAYLRPSLRGYYFLWRKQVSTLLRVLHNAQLSRTGLFLCFHLNIIHRNLKHWLSIIFTRAPKRLFILSCCTKILLNRYFEPKDVACSTGRACTKTLTFYRVFASCLAAKISPSSERLFICTQKTQFIQKFYQPKITFFGLPCWSKSGHSSLHSFE